MKEALEKIRFHYLYPPFFFRNRNKLKEFLLKKIRGNRKDVEAINFIFCSDDYLLQINQEYLQHSTLTDIITFELSPKGLPLLSDIYISIDRIKENAVRYNVPFHIELHRVIIHGLLHLLGYNDKRVEQKIEMVKQEDAYLKEYGFTWNSAQR